MTAKTPVKPAAGNSNNVSPSAKESFLSRLLDPMDSLVEGIYSVLIVLTFTLAARALRAPDGQLQSYDWNVALQIFIAAAGCAIAWGMIDGVMYILTCAFERDKDRRLYRLIHSAPSEEAGVAALADELDDELSPLTSDTERHQIYVALYQRLRSSPPQPAGFEMADVAGGFGTFLVAIIASIPVVLPLLLVPGNIEVKVRASNIVAAIMLFIMGYRWGQYAGGKPFLSGLLLLILGMAMVIVAIPLGG